jgi:hypothetical protein
MDTTPMYFYLASSSALFTRWATRNFLQKKLAFRDLVNETFCKFTLTTNDDKNADSYLFSKFPYISRAGGWLRQLRRSWLFVAFPGFSFLYLSAIKNNHI